MTNSRCETFDQLWTYRMRCLRPSHGTLVAYDNLMCTSGAPFVHHIIVGACEETELRLTSVAILRRRIVEGKILYRCELAS